jgi:hypothetical protein
MSVNFVASAGRYERYVDVGALASIDHRASCSLWNNEVVTGGTSIKYVRTPSGKARLGDSIPTRRRSTCTF